MSPPPSRRLEFRLWESFYWCSHCQMDVPTNEIVWTWRMHADPARWPLYA